MDKILLKSQLDCCIFRDFKSLYYCLLHVFDYNVFEPKWTTLLKKIPQLNDPCSLCCCELYKQLLPTEAAFDDIKLKPNKPLAEIPPSSLFIRFVSFLLYRKSTNNNVVTWRDDTLYSISKQIIRSTIHNSLFPLLLMDLHLIIAETSNPIKLQPNFLETYLSTVCCYRTKKSELTILK